MKNVLLVTYFWPPSGKATVHWPLDMTRLLPHFGWRPAVLTADEDTFSQKDDSLLSRVDPDLRVVKCRAAEPFAAYRRFLGKDRHAPLIASEAISSSNRSLRHRFAVWVRLNLFIPDARVGWYWNAVRAGKKMIQSGDFRAIVSVGPPHTAHLVGKRLSRISEVPHLPVFIDPWTDIAYYRGLRRSRAAAAIDRSLEHSVLRRAARVILMTGGLQASLLNRYPFLRQNSHVLYWGYSEEAFRSYRPIQSLDQEILLHAGNLFDHQNPRGLWKSLRNEIENGRNVKLVFAGSVGPGVRRSLEEEGLSERTELKGFLPYEKMIEELGAASYLLACASESRHVPGKLFEYLRSGKPILAFADENDEMRDILEETRSGMMLPAQGDAKAFFDHLSVFKTDPNVVRRYERKTIAGSLAGILNLAVPG